MRELLRHELCATLLHVCTAQADTTALVKYSRYSVATTAKAACVESKTANGIQQCSWNDGKLVAW